MECRPTQRRRLVARVPTGAAWAEPAALSRLAAVWPRDLGSMSYRERPDWADPRIVVRTTSWRQTPTYIAASVGSWTLSRTTADPPSARSAAVQTSFPRLLRQHAAERPLAPAMREKVYGIWQTTSWSMLEALVRDLAGGLAAAGLQAQRPSGRHRRQPAAPLRRDAGGAGARRRPDSALPGRRSH